MAQRVGKGAQRTERCSGACGGSQAGLAPGSSCSPRPWQPWPRPRVQSECGERRALGVHALSLSARHRGTEGRRLATPGYRTVLRAVPGAATGQHGERDAANCRAMLRA